MLAALRILHGPGALAPLSRARVTLGSSSVQLLRRSEHSVAPSEPDAPAGPPAPPKPPKREWTVKEFLAELSGRIRRIQEHRDMRIALKFLKEIPPDLRHVDAMKVVCDTLQQTGQFSKAKQLLWDQNTRPYIAEDNFGATVCIAAMRDVFDNQALDKSTKRRQIKQMLKAMHKSGVMQTDELKREFLEGCARTQISWTGLLELIYPDYAKSTAAAHKKRQQRTFWAKKNNPKGTPLPEWKQPQNVVAGSYYYTPSRSKRVE